MDLMNKVIVWEPNTENWADCLQQATRQGLKKLLHLSDEGTRPSLVQLACKADAMFATGDLYDPIWEAKCPVFFVFGNHDDPALLANCFHSRPDANVHGRIVQWNGWKIGGVGGCLPYKSHPRGQLTEEEFAEVLHRLGPVDILLTHVAPPMAVTDDDIHACPASLQVYLEKYPPRLHLFGHTHQNLVVFSGRTIHVGTFGGRWIGVG
jgi:Icc-related predicted phosphoesterase